MCSAASPAPPRASASASWTATGPSTGAGTGIGSPASAGTPRASFAARYFGGSDRRGRRPPSRTAAASLTRPRSSPRSGRARARSGRAAPTACHRASADSVSFARENAGTGTYGMGGLCSIPAASCYNVGMINVSETAASKINELLAEENKGGSGLRVFVQGGGCSGFQYGLMIEENPEGSADQIFESHGVKLFVDPISVRYLKGAEVDFVDTITGGGFTIKNPNATSTCGCGSSFTVE